MKTTEQVLMDIAIKALYAVHKSVAEDIERKQPLLSGGDTPEFKDMVYGVDKLSSILKELGVDPISGMTQPSGVDKALESRNAILKKYGI